MNYYFLIFLSFNASIILEHICKKGEIEYRPSFFLNKAAEQSQLIFETLGNYVAYLSSFITLIDFSEIIKKIKDFCGVYLNTIWELFHPLIKIFGSFLYYFKGYDDVMKQYKNYFLIPIGSLVILIVIIYFTKKYKPDFYLRCKHFLNEFFNQHRDHNSSYFIRNNLTKKNDYEYEDNEDEEDEEDKDD